MIVAIGLSLGGTTGYAINPARDLGPRIAHAILPITGKGGSGWGYAIVPILGPMVGGMLGAVLYRLAFKGIFDVWTIVTLIALVLTLLLGVAMNKKHLKTKLLKFNAMQHFKRFRKNWNDEVSIAFRLLMETWSFLWN